MIQMFALQRDLVYLLTVALARVAIMATIVKFITVQESCTTVHPHAPISAHVLRQIHATVR